MWKNNLFAELEFSTRVFYCFMKLHTEAHTFILKLQKSFRNILTLQVAALTRLEIVS